MKLVAASDTSALAPLYAAGWDPPAEIVGAVAAMLADVRARGDDAVLEYTRRFDAPGATLPLRVTLPSLAEARQLVPPEIAAALELAKERIARFHEAQLPNDLAVRDADGTLNALLFRPLGLRPRRHRRVSVVGVDDGGAREARGRRARGDRESART